MAGFKTRTIKAILRGKVNAWLNTIDNEEVVKALRKDVLITGGSIASMLIGESVKDFDIYLRTKETAKLVANYYLKIFSDEYSKAHAGEQLHAVVAEVYRMNLKGEGEMVVTIKNEGRNRNAVQMRGVADTTQSPDDMAEEMVEELNDEALQDSFEKRTSKRYHPVFISDNAITLSNKIQIVMRFVGEPEVIHENYDFAHCKNYYDFAKDDLVLNQLALECLMSKTLRYTGSLYPLCSVFRAKKFIERGWRISAGELLKICYQVSKIDFGDMEMLREQLVGVDALYFFNLMSKIKDHVDSGKTLDNDSLVNLIDEVFNA